METLFYNSPQALLVTDLEGRVIHKNNASNELIGTKTKLANPLLEKEESLQFTLYLNQNAYKALVQRKNDFLHWSLEKEETFNVLRDTETNLYNQAFFKEELSNYLSYINRYKGRGAAILLQIKELEKLQQKEGPEITRSLLNVVATKLINKSRESDIIARWNNDSFAILLPEIEEKNAQKIVNKLSYSIQEEIKDNYAFLVRLHGVCALFSFEDNFSFEEVMHLLEEKEEKENEKEKEQEGIHLQKEVFYDLNNLQRTFSNEPQVMISLKIDKKAATREEEMILDQKKIEAALAYLEKRNKVSLELSSRDLEDGIFLEWMMNALHSIDKSLLYIEINENDLLSNLWECKKHIETLHTFNFKVMITDFYSAFRILKYVQIDQVKLNPILARNMSQNEVDLETFKGLYNACFNLEIPVLVTGIDNEETLELMRKYGIKEGSGRYFEQV